MEVRTQASVVVDRPVGEVFDFAVAPGSQPILLRAAPPLPGVVGIEMLDGRAPETGARRRVLLSDGSSLREEVIALERPVRHCYRWLDPPAAPLHLLVRTAQGDWRFTDLGRRTRVTWSYVFTLASPLAYPLAVPVSWLFRRWMEQSLERLRAALAPGG